MTANTGMVMIVGLFPQVDQFRWVAWFQVASGVLLVIVTVLLFREPLPSYLYCGRKGSWSPAKEINLERRTAVKMNCPSGAFRREPFWYPSRNAQIDLAQGVINLCKYSVHCYIIVCMNCVNVECKLLSLTV